MVEKREKTRNEKKGGGGKEYLFLLKDEGKDLVQPPRKHKRAARP